MIIYMLTYEKGAVMDFFKRIAWGKDSIQYKTYVAMKNKNYSLEQKAKKIIEDYSEYFGKTIYEEAERNTYANYFDEFYDDNGVFNDEYYQKFYGYMLRQLDFNHRYIFNDCINTLRSKGLNFNKLTEDELDFIREYSLIDVDASKKNDGVER